MALSPATFTQASEVSAPSFTFETLEGAKFSHILNQKREKPLYLKFWATWCSYCVEEMPHFQSLYNKHNQAMDFVAVNVGMNDSIARITKYFTKNNYSLPVGFDEKGELVGSFNIVGTPQHVIIDTNGRIVHRSSLINDDLDVVVAALINGEY